LHGQPLRFGEFNDPLWSTGVASLDRVVGEQVGFAANGTPVVAISRQGIFGTLPSLQAVELLIRSGTTWVPWSLFNTSGDVRGVDLTFSGITPLVSFLDGETNFARADTEIPHPVTPEPSTLVLLLTGWFGLACHRIRR